MSTARRAFVLGDPPFRRPDRTSLTGAVGWGVLLLVVAVPLRGLYRATGASMDEGLLLVSPGLVQDGRIPNVDFLHLYGPAALDVLALWYRLAGDTLEAERTFGLVQLLGIVLAVHALGRAIGRVAAAGASILAALLVVAPIGLAAFAWHGGLALGLWATVFAARARATDSARSWWWAGGLTGLALTVRPDLIVALGLAQGAALCGRRAAVRAVAGGAAVGLLPMWFHLVRAGPVAAIDGIVIDPVVRLRPGRTLPRPPSWDRIDGALQALSEDVPPWWGLPAPAASQQLFLWFWAVVVITVGVGAWAVWWSLVGRSRAASSSADRDALAIAGLFALGILPQALQRPDATHLAWVAVVSWPLATLIVGAALARRGGGWRSQLAGPVAVALLLLVVCPFFTYRSYVLHTRVAVHDLPLPFEIVRDDRRFWVGDAALARGLTAIIPEIEARTRPGDAIVVGPVDLRRTVYADTFVYWLFPELEPATYYVEMDPGLADADGSGLAEDIATADVLLLTNTWSGWTEPNASGELGSPEHNAAVADHFCLVASAEADLVLLFERCEGGGGLDPATLAGREPSG